jgi:hypothetical protein
MEVHVRTKLTAAIVLGVAVTVSGQKANQDSSGKSGKGDGTSSKVATLVGCVERGDTPNQFTLVDPQNGKYMLSGARLGRYVGQRVQLVGTADSSRLRIAGGLWPTANVAGQAGAIDPVKAAIAGTPGGGAAGTGDTQLPRIKVKSIQTMEGGCK